MTRYGFRGWTLLSLINWFLASVFDVLLCQMNDDVTGRISFFLTDRTFYPGEK